jgi:hypothetical protein
MSQYGSKVSNPHPQPFWSTLREIQTMSSLLLSSLVESLFGLDSMKGDMSHVTGTEVKQ